MTVGTRLEGADPFFVVGAQRSGSTLIRLMLDHHPRLAVPHEFDFVAELIPERGWPERDEIAAHLEQSASFRRSGLRWHPAASFPELAEDLLRQHQGGKERIGMVVHGHFDRLLRIWPEACFVHLVRDPRDVAPSVVGMGWAGNVWHGASRWVAAEESWERLRSRIPADRAVELRYEDLLRDPPRQLARVCSLLGMDYDGAMLEYAHDTTYKPPDASRTEAWRRRLTAREIRLVEARVGDRLRALGYPASGLAPLHPSKAELLWLSATDWTGRMRTRIRRHGLGTAICDIVSRRVVSLPGLQRRLRARMQETSDRSVQ